MISLLTSPDITRTGFKITVINLDPQLQEDVTVLLNEIDICTNIVLYNLNLETDTVDYLLSVLETSDLVIFCSPNMLHWLSGYIISLPNCFYIEFDSKNLNTLYKLSLRSINDDGIKQLVNNAIQKKYGKAL